MRQPLRGKRPAAQEILSGSTLLAPVRGWNARDPEAAMEQGDAIYMVNMWPTPTAVTTRRGAADHVTGITGDVLALIPYNPTSGAAKLFAATNGGIFDVTVAGTVGASVSSITNGQCRHSGITVTGGSYVFIVNGTNDLRHYNGTTWTTVASYSINGGGTLNTNTIENLNVFKRRMFFIEKDSSSFFYLPVDAIAGNVTRFPLGAVLSKGGKLVAMASWTIDGGAGVDDYAVFASSQGQLVVYKGYDPDNASTWELQGVYDLGKPLGSRCFMKFGGDLLYLSDDGLFPLSKALQSATVDSRVAVTDRISNAFSQAAKSYGANYGWQSAFSLTDALLLVNIPTTEGSASTQYAMNTKSRAWCQITGWNAFCFELLGNQLYMGMEGKVAKAWYGESDFTGNITGYVKAAFDYLGGRTRLKQIRQLRPLFRTNGTISTSVEVDTDFASNSNYGPTSFSPATGSLWGTALWGTGVWSSGATPKLEWRTVAVRPGFCAAVRLRVVYKDATVEWSSTDILFERGAIA